MKPVGYYRFPTISGDRIVFVSEDDLWTVHTSGGTARRLTSGLGMAANPSFSPDGRYLAFTSREEGPAEAFIMPADGGAIKRISYFGEISRVLGWRDNSHVLVATNYGTPFKRQYQVYSVSIKGGDPKLLPVGMAFSVTFGPNGGTAIGRNAVDPARWKRYRGGTAGDILIDLDDTGVFKSLIQTGGNMAYPMWIKERIYFLSDYEGTGNIYSCNLEGKDLKRHTDHRDYYVRFPSSDGKRIVYHAGAEIFLFDSETDTSKPVRINYLSPKTQLNRKYVTASSYLEEFELHPKNHLLGIIARGKPFSAGLWSGPVEQYGKPDGVRYRLMQWLNDGKRFVVVSDESGEDSLEIHHIDASKPPKKLPKLALGRPISIKVSPVSDKIALTNHKNELLTVDLKNAKTVILDSCKYGLFGGFNWSPDGKWLAYSTYVTTYTSCIKMVNVDTRKRHIVTRPVLHDISPVFSPEGKYLFFISFRQFNPVYDNLHFELSFPKGTRPYMAILARDTLSPLSPLPKPSETGNHDDKGGSKASKRKAIQNIKIDFDGIENRIQALPVPDGRYHTIDAIKGKVLYVSSPVEGALNNQNFSFEPKSPYILEAFDFDHIKSEVLMNGITDFNLSRDGTMMACRVKNRIRILKAGEKADESTAKEPPGKKSGWIDLHRMKISVSPHTEWAQIMSEAWRLQRDYFWTKDMSGIDWEKVFKRYRPLLERVSTRGEFSDLLWEMQGELGTSHAYEIGGDYRGEPSYDIGFLGADLIWHDGKKAWKINRILDGDPWDDMCSSPLGRPGLKIKPGDTILAIGGRKLSKEIHPNALLVNRRNSELTLMIGDASGNKPRAVSIKAINTETPARYRDWVEGNRKYVHDRTNGKIGYVHIPDMGPNGFAEFHRYFLSEVDRDGLLVDVRFNGGGHVSSLLLEKLARKRIAYVQTRWFGPEAYPKDSVAGPVIALTNEHAGSDGDIFSHCFKLMKLGPLVGKRTWGGVVGIYPRNLLVDKGITTQPEFSFWFQDVGWKVENYGTDPDIEVDLLPQDIAAGKDSQLERTVQEIMRLLKENPPAYPDLEKFRPDLSLPRTSKQAP